ncbi:MAG: peptidoglycan D,D-transpeptidase FtsI family protein [Solirubrobacteraceae bacterium]
MAPMQRRIGKLFALFVLLLMLAAARSLYLGVFKAGMLRRAALSEQLSTVKVPALRGSILDRNGLVLAVSEPADDISATPYLVRDPGAVALRLAPLLGTTSDVLLRKLTARGTGFVYLARHLPDAQAKAVAKLHIAGISLTPVGRRGYPDNALASQVLGTVGIDGQGLSGLEYSADRVLGGSDGKRNVVTDALGAPISIQDITPARPGRSIALTLDAALESKVEDTLGQVGAAFRPKQATAIVMDPRTNAILAMANWPRVDANDVGGAPAPARQNHAVGMTYEPGSTFKIVTVAGALQAGLVTPDKSFYLPPSLTFYDRTIHDAEARGPVTLTTAEILARSSNIGAIEIGSLLGRQRFDAWVRRFGFGSPTSSDLTGEERGIVPRLSQYSGASMGNLPIGQGESVTALQLATAYAAIANGGVLRPPHLIDAVGGRPTPPPAGRRILDPGVASSVRQMLEGVLAPGGTASEVVIPGYQLAGKTGTANVAIPGGYSATRFVASFVGFAPARDPKVLVAVVVDEPQGGSYSGGQVAAPAFGKIMSFALPYLKIPPG